MKIKITLLTIIAALGLSIDGNAQELKKFGSSIEKKVGPKTIRVPYTDVITYLGYAEPGNEDEIKEDKKFYYIYVWIPAVAPELGVRMMSPVGSKTAKGATESAEYIAHKTSEDYFDTSTTLERSDIVKKEGITEEGAKSAKWIKLDSNDDSSDMPKQPSGNGYNSLLRYTSDAGDPLKALTAGLYRIGFTTYKKGEVKGTFVAEVAAPVKLPGVAMAKTIKELNEALAK